MCSRLLCAFVPAFVLAAMTLGCSFNPAGTGDDVPLFDTTVVEPDLGADGLGDVTGQDSAVGETALDPDTTPTADATADAETALPDSPIDTPLTGSLVMSTAWLMPGNVDLQAEGTAGWAHWGFSTADSFTRKVGSGVIANAITPPPGRFDGYPINFTWMDGDPNPIAMATASGVYRTTSDRMEFNVAAGTEQRELRVYLTTDSAAGLVFFSLSDASAADQAQPLPVPGTPSGAGHRAQVVAARFRSVSPTARLVVRVSKSSGTTVSLLAATVH